MIYGIDWPAWINAVTVVVLAVITFSYARTTRATLRHLEVERQERLNAIRQPFTNVLDVFDRLASDVARMIAATTYEANFDNLRPMWDRYHHATRELANDVRDRSESLYQALERLYAAAENVGGAILQVAAGLRMNTDQDNARQFLRNRLPDVRQRVTEARAEVQRLF